MGYKIITDESEPDTSKGGSPPNSSTKTNKLKILKNNKQNQLDLPGGEKKKI